eukprot:TRINITY_DN1788_c0_g1_i2.p1 TRINITY_DN1788_c0_g1~~TRINITY_DN1788_c0_g1_i2.p1  ORF type:complete len:186 (-),score=9.82 TRINITY_DN1788_c0_g1_i2:343-900(-)
MTRTTSARVTSPRRSVKGERQQGEHSLGFFLTSKRFVSSCIVQHHSNAIRVDDVVVQEHKGKAGSRLLSKYFKGRARQAIRHFLSIVPVKLHTLSVHTLQRRGVSCLQKKAKQDKSLYEEVAGRCTSSPAPMLTSKLAYAEDDYVEDVQPRGFHCSLTVVVVFVVVLVPVPVPVQKLSLIWGLLP